MIRSLIAGFLICLTAGALSQEAEFTPATDANATEPDAWFPRTRTGPRGTLVFNAPQIDSWEGFETLTGWLAFQITLDGAEASPYGSLQFQASTEVDLEEREILLYDAEILSLSIPNFPEDAAEYEILREALTSQPTKVPLELVLEYLPRQVSLPSTEGLNPEPPRIFAATSPAVILSVDSQPQWLPIDGTELEFILNANWDVFRVQGSETAYLLYSSNWFTATELEAAWSWSATLPPDLERLPEDGNWSNARAALPGNLNSIVVPDAPPPPVFYSTEPAELIQLSGDPVWQPLGSEGLQFAANTIQELFQLGDDVFVLLSGRWFTAPGLDGPWSWTTDLPAPFLDIPVDHEKSYLRASVPGTVEAWEAALVTVIPRKATVARGSGELAPDVSYAGDPVFQPIDGTEVTMAVNTSYQVLEYQNFYYLCDKAMWFAGSSPTGPWVLADNLPDEFDRIPPSSPAYNTTFVSVDSADDETVSYSYTAGYEEAYIVDETVVHGTGWTPSVVSIWALYEITGGGYYYPYYPFYPFPPTYGYGSWYDPSSGRYGESIVAYGPYGAARSTAVYNPTSGVYARGQAFWDSDEYAGRSYGYNPNTDTSTASNRYHDFEDNEGWSQRVVTRGDEWRYKESEWEDGQMHTEFENSRGAEGQVDRTREGDTITSEGSVQLGDQEATFESTREREGDALVSEGSLTGENRSADFESTFQDGSGNISVTGSEGGTGEFTRELEGGELTGSGTITRDGQTIETDTTRTAEGVQRNIESSEGGQAAVARQGDERAFVGETSGGDVYAGRDGEVYQKTDDGWSKVENPSRGDSAAAATSTQRSAAGGQTRAPDAATTSSLQRSQPAPSFDSLDRDFQSRSSGYQRYGNRQQTAAGRGGGFSRRGRR